MPGESESLPVTVTSGESASKYRTDWLPPPSEFDVPGSVSVKSAFETSKKTFPTASIFRRACVVATFGSASASEPSFGVLAAST